MSAKSRWSLLGSLLLIAALTVACGSTATTGSSDAPAAPAAPAKPDYRAEVGDNGLPTPRALEARFIDAIGGEDAIRKPTSVTAKGTMELAAMGMSGELVLYTAAPNKMVMNVEMGGMGSMSNGYNGEVGWSENPMTGPQILEGDMLDQLKLQADFYGPVNFAENYPTRETLGEGEWAGEAVYEVKLVDKQGNESVQYFSKETALLVGTKGMQSSEMGEMEVSAEIGGYQQFGDLMVATTTVLNMMGMEIKQTTSEVTFDDVDPAVFEPPASIKALLEQ